MRRRAILSLARGINLKPLVILLVSTAITLPATWALGPKACHSLELQQIRAASESECCDAAGTWEGCPAVADNCAETAFFTWVLPGVLCYNGWTCDDAGSDCKWAEAGPSMATCDAAILSGNSCTLYQNQPCNDFFAGTCEQFYVVMAGPIDVSIMQYRYWCQCSGGVDSGTDSLTNQTCSGDSCWL